MKYFVKSEGEASGITANALVPAFQQLELVSA